MDGPSHVTTSRRPDNTALRTFEKQCAEAANAGNVVDHPGGGFEVVTHPTWGYELPRIYESMASITDYLARIAGVLPDGSAYYCREKGHALGDAVISLLAKIAHPSWACDADIDELVHDVENGDYLVTHSCAFRPGHAGDHQRGTQRDSLDAATTSVLRDGLSLATIVRAALINADPEQVTAAREQIAELRSALNLVEILLPAAIDCAGAMS